MRVSAVFTAALTVWCWPASLFSSSSGPVSLSRYIVETTPATYGVVALDTTIVESFCRDEDGCEVILEMLGWNQSSLGDVVSISGRMFLSSTSNSWRFSNGGSVGTDDNGNAEEMVNGDCYFGDGETTLNNPTPPYFWHQDSGPGFGLDNPFGGAYSDQYLYCRVVLID